MTWLSLWVDVELNCHEAAGLAPHGARSMAFLSPGLDAALILAE
jgi:hypothetical protein